jgi:hypothetical protein
MATLRGASSRIDSPFRNLGERIQRKHQSTSGTPATPATNSGRHIEVWEDAAGWVPGLLVAWERRNDGWWGRVVIINNGEAVEQLVTARPLRPLQK